MTRILPLLILACACGKADQRTPPAPPSPSLPLAQAQVAKLAHATQADLAQDIAGAEQLGTWREVQQRWQGQALRWTVTRPRLLCSAADDCNVAAFPIQRPAKQGWMPLLSFAPGQYDALAKVCGGQDPCEVTIEGTLSELDVSPELPTKVRITNVRIVPVPADSVRMAHNGSTAIDDRD